MARIVNIQPGQLAATVTARPGTLVYMAPEAAQEKEIARCNTAIDIFSLGVVSLFTLIQIFPRNLKPATYVNLLTRRIAGRMEIERRGDYIQLMNAALGETHPLVRLTIDCLEYIPEDRPSAVQVSRRLEEIGRTVPQNCTETKLELIRRHDVIFARKEEEIQQIRAEHQRQLSVQLAEREAQFLEALRTEEQEHQQRIRHIQAEKQEQVHGLEQQTFLQQQQLEAQCREIEQLSSQLRRLELQTQEEESQKSRQRDVPVTSPKVRQYM